MQSTPSSTPTSTGNKINLIIVIADNIIVFTKGQGTPSSNDNGPIIIGSIVGTVVAVIVLIILVILMIKGLPIQLSPV